MIPISDFNHKFVDRTGVKYGKLTPMFVARRTERNCAVWMCQCDCGKTKEVVGDKLQGKYGVRSCGCLVGEARRSHSGVDGRSKHPLFNAWKNLIDRCCNLKSAAYFRYGGAGISVCDEWKNSFHRFCEDVGVKPGGGYSIDRIDNSLGYFPGNVRWANARTQARNRKSNLVFDFNGKRMILMEICEYVGANYSLVNNRISVLGWPLDRALNEKPGIKRRRAS